LTAPSLSEGREEDALFHHGSRLFGKECIVREFDPAAVGNVLAQGVLAVDMPIANRVGAEKVGNTLPSHIRNTLGTH
jgi:hypothetical protein